MSNDIQELRRAMPALTAGELEHIARFRSQPLAGFDDADISHLVIVRRAVQAGFYSEAVRASASATPPADDAHAHPTCECEFCRELLPMHKAFWS